MRGRQPSTWISVPTMIYHNVLPREVRTKSLSIPSKNLPDILPLRTGHDSSQVRGIQIKKHLYSPFGPRGSKVGPSMGSITAPGALRIRDGKGWAHKRPAPRRMSAMDIPAHVRVLAGHDPWVFLEGRHIALGTGRIDPRTIRIDRQESRVDHQANPRRIPTNGMPGPQLN